MASAFVVLLTCPATGARVSACVPAAPVLRTESVCLCAGTWACRRLTSCSRTHWLSRSSRCSSRSRSASSCFRSYVSYAPVPRGLRRTQHVSECSPFREDTRLVREKRARRPGANKGFFGP